MCKEYMLSVPVLCLVSPLGIKLSNILTSPKEHPIVTQSPLQQNKSPLQILVSVGFQPDLSRRAGHAQLLFSQGNEFYQAMKLYLEEFS